MSVNISFRAPDSGWNDTETLIQDEVVIPILESPSLIPFVAMSMKIQGQGKSQFLAGVKPSFYTFPVDMAFAVTYHKMQGRTVPAVILDMSSTGTGAAVTVPAIYVGVSRVRRGEDIRILPLSAENRVRLKGLKFNDTLVKWHAKC